MVRLIKGPSLNLNPNPIALALTKAGISASILEAISEENACLGQTSDVRNDPKFFVAALDKARLHAIRARARAIGLGLGLVFVAALDKARLHAWRTARERTLHHYPATLAPPSSLLLASTHAHPPAVWQRLSAIEEMLLKLCQRMDASAASSHEVLLRDPL